VKREFLNWLLLAAFISYAPSLTSQCPRQPCPVGADCFSPSEFLSYALSPNSEWLGAAVADGSILVWEVANGRRHQILKCAKASSEALAFTPDGKILAVGDGNGQIQFLQNPMGGNARPPIQDHEGIEAITFSPDGKHLFSFGETGLSIRTWPELRRESFIAVTNISSFGLNRDGTKFAVGTEDGRVTVWSIGKDKPTKTLDLESGNWSNALAFSHDDRLLVSGNGHNSITIWDLEYGTQIQTLMNHQEQVLNVGFLTDGQTIFSAADDEIVRTWDIGTGQQRRIWKMAPGFLSSDSKLFLTLASTGKIVCWDFSTMQKVRTFSYKSPNED
jgi:WD40 repeat protein